MEFYYYYYYLNYFSQEGVQKRGPNIFFMDSSLRKSLWELWIQKGLLKAMSELPQKAIWNTNVEINYLSSLSWVFVQLVGKLFFFWMSNTYPLHIIIVEVATTMRRSPLIQLREIFHPSATCISAYYCFGRSPRHNKHLRQFNGTGKPDKETALCNITVY